MMWVQTLILAAAMPAPCVALLAQGDPPHLMPVTAGIHDATLKDLDDGSWEIVTTGGDPFLFLTMAGGLRSPRRHVLTFECICPQGTDVTEVRPWPPDGAPHEASGPGLAATRGWATYSIDLAEVFARNGGKWETLRLDTGNLPDKAIRIRGIRLREPDDRERRLAIRREARKSDLRAQDARMVAYLSRRFPCTVTNVAARGSAIVVTGSMGGNAGAVALAEVPMWADPTALRTSPTLLPLRGRGRFRVSLPRLDGARDRLLSRWAVVRATPTGLVLRSGARYADTVAAIRRPPLRELRSKKGLAGWWLVNDTLTNDLDALGIGTVTVNILLNDVVGTMPGPGWTAFRCGGKTYYSRDEGVARYDRLLAETAKRGIVVCAIILVPQGYRAPQGSWVRAVAHPDADPSGIFVMPNMEGRDAVEDYAAAMDFLARRYCRADGRYGRIHHWILHNEINAGWVWTNAGEKTDTLYMDLYHRSMRLADLIVRQYDPNAKVFISLEHHWNGTPEPHFYRGKRLLELLRDYCRVEGDFEWALAFHPYPDDLRVPRTWEDAHTTFALDTPKITPRNLEVLDAWADQKSTWFRGRTPRTIYLTEQGINSPDYTEKSLQEQAAGMAYTWKKLQASRHIEAYHHNSWADVRDGAGLRVGLRKYPDEPGAPYGKKPIWEVYRAMGTPDEDRVLDPYKAVIGVSSWDEVRHTEPIR